MEVLSFFKKRNNYFLFLSIAVVLYGITAFKSDGFYQVDEHYQIIEFAQLKSGNIEPESLPWEFHEKMRPTLQPMIAYGVFSFLEAFGVDNPYTKALVLRLLTALLALVAIHRFVKVTETQIQSNWGKRCYYFLAFFLYFLPYVNVRFSSETWSGLFLLLGVSYVLRKDRNYYMLGVLLGVAFLFRFQISFAVLGLFLYLYFSRTSKLKDVLKALAGILILVFVGIVLDSWFYGEFVVSQWNYVYQNVILGKAASFGVSPWYGYVFILYYAPLLATGIIVLFALLVKLRYEPKNMVLWIVVSSILIHSLVARKDARFLFPLLNFVPILLMGAGQIVKHKLLPSWMKNKLLKFGTMTYLLMHFTLALGVSQYNRNEIVNNLTKNLYQNYHGRPIAIYYYGNVLPKNLFKVHPMPFYYDSSVHFKELTNLKDVAQVKTSAEVNTFIWFNEKDVAGKNLNHLEGYELVQESCPQYIQQLYTWLRGKNRHVDNEVLYLKTNRESVRLHDQ